MVVTKQSVQASGGVEARADTSTPSLQDQAEAGYREANRMAVKKETKVLKVEGWRYIGQDAVVNVVSKEVPGIPSTVYEFRNGETVNLVEGQVSLAGNPEFEQVDPR